MFSDMFESQTISCFTRMRFPYAQVPWYAMMYHVLHLYVCSHILMSHTCRAGLEGGFAFAFIEGAMVTAVREGHWVLLDEINLASAETLQRLASLLEVNTLRNIILMHDLECIGKGIDHLM